MIRILVLWLALTAPVFAVSNPAELLPDPAQEQRARALGQQLRCLVCQNNSVEESEAEFARDLRRVIRTRIQAGDDDAAVIVWMSTRYGDFVRLNPAFTAQTALLWASPLLALLAGALAVILSRRRRARPPAPLTDAEQDTLRKLTEP